MFQIVLVLLVTWTGSSLCGNVLVWNMETSHWLNAKHIIEELIGKGHNVTALLTTASIFGVSHQPARMKTEIVEVPYGPHDTEALIDVILKLWMYEKPYLSAWEFYQRLKVIMSNMIISNKAFLNAVLRNEGFLEKLRQSKYDIILADPVVVGGELLALQLGIPFVYTLRFSPASAMERQCGQLPSPPSYVPATLSELPSFMTFTQRITNLLSYSIQDLFFSTFWGQWDSYFSEILGKPTTFCETMGKAEIWLIRTYWDFEFPRPLLPNFVFVGGLHCRPAKPLSQELEEFVQSSGEHGIVIFSLGSLVKNLTAEKANMIAEALGEIPQKVVWSYAGEQPKTLASNTMLYKWLPQNDLLGHPKTRVFITHGGTNGIYEAIYHGVPMIGIPLFADQPDNMAHMKAKGAAVVLSFVTLNKHDLVNAINTVINDTSYKENVLKLSQIQRDQPMSPLERAVFWIEFVMRHGGAQHLRPEAHSLSWYQYHCLDVIAFLFICLVIILFVLKKCCMFCCRKCRGTRVKKNKTE
ncbi:UDP-glucuronosyltransferase 2A2-like isoform X3 [Stegostoma tigrinum]|uniref:UDP-glucuronosyltransferase 2A2-like isoform X3 n=1 Tax=Stegostoma tigrinum TaxID=3053191 RepID=UPI00202B5601|nr:UDP-glucuronosyltransferase 2A2-like isoform X3 [Stegostoma tigrinum]